MEILLNGEKLDVEFENEKFLGEVLHGVANWLESDGYCLKEFCIDGKRYSPSNDFAEFQQDFSTIRKLELNSAPHSTPHNTPNHTPSDERNMLDTSLEILRDYFQLASNAFEQDRFVFLQDFFSSPEPLFELLERSIGDISELQVLRQVLLEWGYFQDVKFIQNRPKADMQAALLDILQILEAYEPSIAGIKRQLIAKQAELEAAVVQLQNGQIEQCMFLVSELSLLLEQLLKEVRQESNLGTLFVQLRPFLQDLTMAIEETDTVAIGDLVEYEIIPLVQQIIDELGGGSRP